MQSFKTSKFKHIICILHYIHYFNIPRTTSGWKRCFLLVECPLMYNSCRYSLSNATIIIDCKDTSFIRIFAKLRFFPSPPYCHIRQSTIPSPTIGGDGNSFLSNQSKKLSLTAQPRINPRTNQARDQPDKHSPTATARSGTFSDGRLLPCARCRAGARTSGWRRAPNRGRIRELCGIAARVSLI